MLGEEPCLEVLELFFSRRRRHTRCSGDWSSDVCSSDLSPTPYRAAGGPTPPSGRSRSSVGWRRAQALAGATPDLSTRLFERSTTLVTRAPGGDPLLDQLP